MKKIIVNSVFILVMFAKISFAQIGIGTPTPNVDAILELNSSNQGMKFPRMTTNQRTSIISPAKGLTVFDTQMNRLMVNFGTSTSPLWKALGGLPILNQLSLSSSAAYALRSVNSSYSGNCIRVRRRSDNAETNIGFVNGVLDINTLINFTTYSNPTPILDQVTGAKAAFSIRKLSNSYTGSCIRVRRSTDNSEQDIGFFNGELDVTSLLSFIGNNSGFVVKIYDQSGNSLDAFQNISSLQARIVSLGVLETINGKPAINFSPDGTVTGYQINVNDATLSDWTISTITQSSLSNFSTMQPVIFDTETSRLSLSQFNSSSYGPTFGNSSGSVTGSQLGNLNVVSYFGIINNTSLSVIQNGVIVATGASVQCGIPTFATLGCRFSFDQDWFKGKMSEIIIYSMALSVQNRQIIEASQDTYFGINNDAFVVKWYDQSGNNRDLEQSNFSSQPRIVNNGVIESAEGKPTLYFDGLASYLFRNESFIYPQGNSSIFSVFKSAVGNQGKYLLGEGNTSTNFPFYSPIMFSGAAVPSFFYRNSANTTIINIAPMYPTSFNSNLQIYAVEDTGVKVSGFLNGNTGSFYNYSRSTTNLNSFALGVTRRTDLQNYFKGYISEIIVAPLLSSLDRQLMQTNQNNYFFHPALTTPSSPVSPSVGARNGEVIILWNAPNSNGGDIIFDYKIEYKLASDINWSVFNDGVSVETSCIVNGLVNNSLYNFRIYAVNNLGIGEPTSILNSTPLNSYFVPTEPNNLTYSRSSGQIILNWTAPISNGGTPVTDYVIEYKLSSSSTWSNINDDYSSLTSSVITTLSDTSNYNFRVSALNSVGLSLPSNMLNVPSLDLTPLTVVLSPSDSKILVQWSSILNVSNYKVEYKLQGTPIWTNSTILNLNHRGYEINGLTNGQMYEIQVSALANNSSNLTNSVIKMASPSVNIASSVYNQILINGQSLSLGISGGVALTMTQPYNNKMLNFPLTLNNNLNTGGIVPESAYTDLVPLVEPNRGVFNNNLETSSSAMANMISSLSQPNSFNTIISLHGIGGKQYSELKKGGTLSAYENGQTQSKCAMNFSLADSKGYKIRATAIIHGERDQAINTPIATYESNLVEWQSDYEVDSKQLTGQSENVPMFINQTSS